MESTPGPWFAEELDLGWSVFHESGIAAICRVHGGVTNDAGIDAAEANARLIAAAPQLLAACEAAMLYGNQGETPDGLSVDTLLRDAIKAAKGVG